MNVQRIAWIAGGIVVLLLVLNIGQCASKSDYDEQRAAWDAERRTLQDQINASRAENEELLARIRADSVQAAPIVREVDSLLIVVERERAAKTRVIRELETRIRVVSDTGELRRLASQAVVEAQNARQEADTLARALVSARGIIDQQLQHVAALSGRLQATQLRADSAIALLNRAPVHKGDKLLGLIPLPSRTTSFLVGTALGVVATVVVTR